ncbi:hypothetical protein KTC77_28335, partial [Klebsiella pneumoniae]|nr:hypothetical protein [Klebsiella pneumoniae]
GIPYHAFFKGETGVKVQVNRSKSVHIHHFHACMKVFLPNTTNRLQKNYTPRLLNCGKNYSITTDRLQKKKQPTTKKLPKNYKIGLTG